jgi:Domain of unknown function (DUF4602)
MVKRKKPVKEKNDFLEAVRDIRNIATQRMDSKARRQFLEKEAKKLGARPKKNPKIPYNIYQGILKKEKQIIKQAKEDFQLSRESNYFNPVSKREKKLKPRNSQPSTPTIGKYKNGTLFIKKKSL